MKNKTDYKFTYYSDGAYKTVTIPAENLDKAVDTFCKNFGKSTSFSVSL